MSSISRHSAPTMISSDSHIIPTMISSDSHIIPTMISSDSHIIEPPDLWIKRVGGPMAERVPQVRREPGGDWWYIDGRRSMSFLGIQTGDRFDKNATELRIEASFDEVRPGAYDPAAFIAENRTDGVAASVIYPSEALLAYSIADSELCSITMATYNDFIAEFCTYDNERLKGIALINLDDIDEGINELTRCRNMGLAGAMISVMPPAHQGYDHPRYEPFWAAAVDLDVPLSMHVATGRALISAGGQTGPGGQNTRGQSADEQTGPGGQSAGEQTGPGGQSAGGQTGPGGQSADEQTGPNVRSVSESAFYLQDHFVRKSLGEMIFAGVFERHTGLRVGSVEHEVGWIPFWLFQMDYCYTDRPLRGDWHRFADPDARPSHFFSSNCFVSFQEDAVGVRVRDTYGTHTLMWGSDYPHTESTFPRSREVVAETLADVPADEQRMILRDNCAALYGFNIALLEADIPK